MGLYFHSTLQMPVTKTHFGTLNHLEVFLWKLKFGSDSLCPQPCVPFLPKSFHFHKTCSLASSHIPASGILSSLSVYKYPIISFSAEVSYIWSLYLFIHLSIWSVISHLLSTFYVSGTAVGTILSHDLRIRTTHDKQVSWSLHSMLSLTLLHSSSSWFLPGRLSASLICSPVLGPSGSSYLYRTLFPCDSLYDWALSEYLIAHTFWGPFISVTSSPKLHTLFPIVYHPHYALLVNFPAGFPKK